MPRESGPSRTTAPRRIRCVAHAQPFRSIDASAENKRMDRLRDVEELMEVERVGLLMERRELYFKRCRFWLGD